MIMATYVDHQIKRWRCLDTFLESHTVIEHTLYILLFAVAIYGCFRHMSHIAYSSPPHEKSSSTSTELLYSLDTYKLGLGAVVFTSQSLNTLIPSALTSAEHLLSVVGLRMVHSPVF